MRFLYRPWVCRLIGISAIGYYAYYLWWRTADTLNPHALWFSLLLAAEANGFVSFILFLFMTWDWTIAPRSSYGRG